MKNIEDLDVMWVNLVSIFISNKNLIQDTFDRIESFYKSSDRYYHNLDHIGYMLSKAVKFKKVVNDYNSILFAIWFHDVIYDPKKSDNEEMSSEFAEEFLKKINFDIGKIKNIKNLILKTKNHSIIDSNEDFDTKFFLDLDLLIFGVKKKKYRKYTENIRKEYSFMPDKIYKLERIKILERFLSQNIIFRTEEFRKRYEILARKNIKSEIKFLLKLE